MCDCEDHTCGHPLGIERFAWRTREDSKIHTVLESAQKVVYDQRSAFGLGKDERFAHHYKLEELKRVAHIQEDLSQRIRVLEQELRSALDEKERAFRYHWVKGQPRCEAATLAQHRQLRFGLLSYVLHSRTLVILTAPIIYLGLIPFSLLDFFLAMYQTVCFPVYGIPKVKRTEYVIFDRGQLKYLNVLERFNCMYCSYANGLCAYFTEVAARTEQHWCPIKHARRLRAPHSRYPRFLDFGDASRYRQQIESVRNDFWDLRNLNAPRSDSNAK